jgi:DHA1 family multidrug resistance protein-like MFS transporter
MKKLRNIQLNNTLLIVFGIYFVQGIFMNLGHPVTPEFVGNMGYGDYYFGFYFAAMSLGLLIGAPIWGVLGDRGHKRTYIVAGLVVYAIGQYAFGFVGDPNIMILFRFMSGFGVSASMTLLMSHLIEHSNDADRAIHLGWLQGLSVIGASVGYLIGGNLPEIPFFVTYLQTDDLRNIFLIQSVLVLLHASYIFLLIKPTLHKPLDHTSKRRNPFSGFASIRHMNKNLIVFFISLSLISLGAINVTKYSEVVMEKFGYSTADIGNFVFWTGIVSIIATIILVPLVAKLKQDFNVMIIIQILSAVIVFIVFRSNQLLLMLYTLFMLYVILKTIYVPLEQAYISSHSKPGQYGEMMGVRQAFFSVGLVLGPLIGGFLFEIKMIYVFDFSVLMFVLGAILLIIVGRNIKLETEQTTKQ